jgi:3-oxoacyl-[acyl-carrier protein] reductase
VSGPPVTIVTGATGGLGSALVTELASRGAKLCVTDRPEADLASVRAVAESLGAVAIAAPADIRDPTQVEAVAKECVAELGSIEALVNVAGGSYAMLTGQAEKAVWDLSDENWALVIETNLTGAFNWLRAVSPTMRAARSGTIVLVASGSGLRPGPRMAAYAAAKAGVVGLMKAAARDLGPDGVRVNAVNPGLIVHGGVPETAVSEEAAESVRRDTTLGRLPEPEHFARFVADLLRHDSISGQVLNLDSRMVM